MSTDEQEIRQLISTWLAASKSGDVNTLLSLMTEDVVFLIPGRDPMRKSEFATIVAAQSQPGSPAIDGVSHIQEIQVHGDCAFLWSNLKVTITPPNQPAPIVRAGHTLTIFSKQNGKWLLSRDANLLTVQTTSAPLPQ